MENVTISTSAKLFVTDYASYNAGLQFVCGQWYDLGDYSDASELLEAVTEHYQETLNDPLYEDEKQQYEKNSINTNDLELMFTDFEGFPDSLYSESMSEDEINNIITFANLDDRDREIVRAFIDCFGGDFKQALENYEDAYCGEYESDRD